MAIVPAELANANITQDTARVPLETANPMFVARWLEMDLPSRFIAVHTLGVAVQGINLRDVRRIPVPIVSRREQDAIADCISEIEQHASTAALDMQKLRLIKCGLMNDLLTPRIRVLESFFPEEITS